MAWRKWFSGLVNTVVGGVSGAAAGAFVEWKVGDPVDWHGIWTIVIVMSVWNFFSFLKTHPLPLDPDAVDPASLKNRND